MKQDSGIGRRNDRYLIQHPPDGRALANDAFEAMLGTNLAFEMQLLVFRFAHWRKATSCNSFEVGECNGRAHNILPMFTVCFLVPTCYAVRFCLTGNSRTRAALLLRHPIQDFSEANWNVELNHLCHKRPPRESVFLRQPI